MKKNILRLMAMATIVATLFSCEKEEVKQVSQQDQPEAEKKTIKDPVTGEYMYSGYGYDPVEDRAYLNAVDPLDAFESTDIKEALTVEVTTIETKEQLEKFVQRNFSIEADFTIAPAFKLGISIENDIQKKTTIDENHVTVIARIKSKSHKYICNKYPFLTARAEKTVERGSASRFIRNYGHMFVTTRVVGGEVYYVYTYDYRQVSHWNKSTFKAKVTAGISERFGVSAGGGVSNEDKNLIGNAQKSASITSTIPGFAPAIITDINQVNGQIASIQNYLNSHPEKATTVEMALTPFHTFMEVDYPEFGAQLRTEFEKYAAE